VLAPATLAALPSTRAIPDRDVFYVAFTKSSVRPLGLPIYVARVPAAPFASRLFDIGTLPSRERSQFLRKVRLNALAFILLTVSINQIHECVAGFKGMEFKMLRSDPRFPLHAEPPHAGF
jgi:hypothetical protein